MVCLAMVPSSMKRDPCLFTMRPPNKGRLNTGVSLQSDRLTKRSADFMLQAPDSLIEVLKFLPIWAPADWASLMPAPSLYWLPVPYMTEPE